MTATATTHFLAQTHPNWLLERSNPYLSLLLDKHHEKGKQPISIAISRETQDRCPPEYSQQAAGYHRSPDTLLFINHTQLWPEPLFNEFTPPICSPQTTAAFCVILNVNGVLMQNQIAMMFPQRHCLFVNASSLRAG